MRQQKYFLILSPSEYRLTLYGLLHFRNKLIDQHRYPDAVNELLTKLHAQGGAAMDNLAQRLKAYIETHPFDTGDSDHGTVLDQLCQAYAESHEADLPEISKGFEELETFLDALPLDDNNAVFNLCCHLCTAYEHKAFLDGLQYGAHLMLKPK